MRALLLLTVLAAACSHAPPSVRRNTPVERPALAERGVLMNTARDVAIGRGLDITYFDAARGRFTALSPEVEGRDGLTRERWHYHIDNGSIGVHRNVEHRAPGDHWRTSPYLAPDDDRRAEHDVLDEIELTLGGLSYGMTTPLPATE